MPPREPRPNRETNASVAPIRSIPLPDGAPLNLTVQPDTTFGIVWDVALERAGVALGRFRLSFVDWAVPGKRQPAAATAALWQLELPGNRPPPDGGLVLLAALALISQGSTGKPRAGSLLELIITWESRGIAAQCVQELGRAAAGSGLPMAMVHDGLRARILVVCQPQMSPARLATAVVGGEPLPSGAALLPAVESLMSALDAGHTAHTAPARPNGQIWMGYLLCTVARMGGLSHEVAGAWYQEVSLDEKHPQRAVDAKLVWNNTPAGPDTDPADHLVDFVVDRNTHGLLAWLRTCPAPVWQRAVAWMLAKTPETLYTVLPSAPPEVLAALPEHVVVDLLHRAPADLRTSLIAAVGTRPSSRA